MDKRPPLYDYTSQSCAVFLESLKILGVSLPNLSVESYIDVKDILQQLSLLQACSVDVGNDKFSLSFNQLFQKVVKESNSPLHLACEMGDLGKVKALCVFSHIDVSNKNGDTPLHVACRHGHGDICKYLVSEMVYKGDRKLPDNEYMKDYLCDVHFFERHNFYSDLKQEHCIIILCNHTPSLFSLNNVNELPVHLALKCSNQSCLECFKNVPDTLLIFSIRMGDGVIFDHKCVCYIDEYRTILHYHNDSWFKETIDAGLTVHLQDCSGLPFVKTFCFYCKDVLAVVEYISRYSDYPVHYLIQHYYSTFLLVSRNIDSSNLIDEAWSKYYSQTDIIGDLPLHLLCERYNDMNNNALLGIFSQCKINLKNKYGLTPFEIAFNKLNYLTCIWLMLRKQCDVYLYCTETETRRCEAIETLTKQIFEDTHITSFSPCYVIAGDTLLHVALKCGTEEAIEFL